MKDAPAGATVRPAVIRGSYRRGLVRHRVQINATQFLTANILLVGLGNLGVLIDLLARWLFSNHSPSLGTASAGRIHVVAIVWCTINQVCPSAGSLLGDSKCNGAG